MRTEIRNILKRFGYDIVKYNPQFIRGKIDKDILATEYKWLGEFDFKTILDIGANQGQFSERMRILFPDTMIYALEPLPKVYEELLHNFKGDKLFNAINFAASDCSGNLSFYLNEHSASSSILQMTEQHTSSFDFAVKTQPVTVNTDRLDNIIPIDQIEQPLLVKIDVQGYEDKVIEGGSIILSKADMVIIELSYVELFSGQALFNKVYTMLSNLGFNYAGSIDQLRSPLNNRVLQEDGVFLKN
ncbi:MAG: FkbM family methyltransferase [Chitinophagaceae bacterium]|nr:FkbM family methyltransferase [Chitinophagaceae bacterium]